VVRRHHCAPDAKAWHVPSNSATSVRELATRLAELAGAPSPRLRAMPGWLIIGAGLISPTIRELPEMQYQFRQPFHLDSSLTEQTFDLKPSDLDDILRENIDQRSPGVPKPLSHRGQPTKTRGKRHD
jgi:nucleoside-diphosphate-sugar epimerase